MSKVFISYSRKDLGEVVPFVNELRQQGVDCWFDESINSGDPEFEETIMKEIDKCVVFLYMLSEKSRGSTNVKNEHRYAERTDKKIIPLLLKGAGDNPKVLFHFLKADCIDIYKEEQKQKLVRNLREWGCIDERIAGLLADLDRQKQKKDALLLEINTSKPKLKGLIEGYNAAVKEVFRLRNEISIIRTGRPEIESCDSELIPDDAETVKALQNKVSEQENAIESQQKSIQESIGRCASLEKNLSELENLKLALEQEKTTLQDAVKDSQEQRDLLQADVNALECQNSDLKAHCGSLKEEADELKCQISTLESEMKVLQDDLQESRNQCTSLNEKLSELEDRISKSFRKKAVLKVLTILLFGLLLFVLLYFFSGYYTRAGYPLPRDMYLSDSTLVLDEGGTDTLSVSFVPEDAAHLPVVWKSSDPEVLSVDYKGCITCLKPGSVTVTVRCGGFERSCSCIVATDTVITVGDVSFRMKYVQGGTFAMGATPEQGSSYGSDERPVHKVTVDSYCIGETEVTQALWKVVMGNDVRSQRDSAGIYNSLYGEGDTYPMYYLNYYDCLGFIEQLNSITGMSFRLPTEAEWEFAARGGNKHQEKGYYIYSGSNEIYDVAWRGGGSTSYPVKGKKPNELGIYDMTGNVREWCQDWYGSYTEDQQTNPLGASSGEYRVIRGGDWNDSSSYCRTSYRSYYTPKGRVYHVGLRLVLQ